MLKYFLTVVLSIVLIYLVIQVFNALELKINESSGWKTDVLFSISTILIILFSIAGIYSFFSLLMFFILH